MQTVRLKFGLAVVLLALVVCAPQAAFGDQPGAVPPNVTGPPPVVKDLFDMFNFFTATSDDIRLYQLGNTIMALGAATAIAGILTIVRQGGLAAWRSWRLGQVQQMGVRLQLALGKYGGTQYRGARDELLDFIARTREIPWSTYIRDARDGAAVDAFLEKQWVRDDILATPAGRIWLAEYERLRNRERLLHTQEIYAHGVHMKEAADLLKNHLTQVPEGMPRAGAIRAANQVYAIDRILDEPDVRAYLQAHPEARRWADRYHELKAQERAAYEAMRTRFLEIRDETLAFLQRVDSTGRGLSSLEAILQRARAYNLLRSDEDAIGTFSYRANGAVETLQDATDIYKKMPNFEDEVGNTMHSIRALRFGICRTLFMSLGAVGLGTVAMVGGHALSNYGNERRRESKGKSIDEEVKEGQQKAAQQKTVQAAVENALPAVAARLAQARTGGENPELVEVYAAIRDVLRKEENLTKLVNAIKAAPWISDEKKKDSHLEKSFNDFMKKDDAANVFIDIALAQAAEKAGIAGDVKGIQEILFSNDEKKQPFQNKLHNNHLYQQLWDTMWPGLVPNPTSLPFEEKDLSRIRTEIRTRIDAIGARYRVRHPPPTQPGGSIVVPGDGGAPKGGGGPQGRADPPPGPASGVQIAGIPALGLADALAPAPP